MALSAGGGNRDRTSPAVDCHAHLALSMGIRRHAGRLTTRSFPDLACRLRRLHPPLVIFRNNVVILGSRICRTGHRSPTCVYSLLPLQYDFPLLHFENARDVENAKGDENHAFACSVFFDGSRRTFESAHSSTLTSTCIWPFGRIR